MTDGERQRRERHEPLYYGGASHYTPLPIDTATILFGVPVTYSLQQRFDYP